MDSSSPRFVIAGRLTRDYIVFPSGDPLLDMPGGNALYAAIGLAIWEPDPPPGIVARVGQDYPQEWLENFDRYKLDRRGVRVLPQAVDLRSFSAFSDRSTRSYVDPVVHFARLGLPFPKELLGMTAANIGRSVKDASVPIDSRTDLQPTSLRQSDFPPDYLEASAAHLCPLDYLSHSLLPAVLRQAQFTTVTLDPASGYMNPTFWNDVPALLTGLTAFMPAEEDVRAIFQGRTNDLWAMAEALASYGCEIIIFKCGERGQLVYDAASHTRWEVPSYPARLVNPIGAGDAFCGGFLAGYRRAYDPVEATLYGNISASLVIEGHQAGYALDTLPGLPAARLEALRQSVRKV